MAYLRVSIATWKVDLLQAAGQAIVQQSRDELIPLLRRTYWTAAAMDGINAAVIGLMVAVTAELGSTAVVDLLTGMLAVSAFLVMALRKPNFGWLILAGAVVGLLHTLV